MGARTFRILPKMAVLVAIALLPPACGARRPGDSAGAAAFRENALVRFVNATTFDQPVDLYRDETRVLSDVRKDEASGYADWLAERHDIELRFLTSRTPIAANSEVLIAGQRYTVVGFDKTDGKSGVAVFRENVAPPEKGKSRLRLIHVADGVDGLAVFPSGSAKPLVDGVDYKTDISAEIAPDVKSLEIRKEGSPIVAVRIQDLALEAGKSYTIIVAADADHKLRAIQVENASPIREGYLRR